MQEPGKRKFTIWDAMILVAATAVGLRVVFIRIAPKLGVHFQDFRYGSNAIREIVGGIAFFWSVALIFLRLLQPRPPLKQLVRQPGFIACLAAVFVFLANVSLQASQLISRIPNRSYYVLNMFLLPTVTFVTAPAVALAWIVLFISGEWEPEAGWVDRAGRAIGLLWIGMYTEMLIENYVRALLF